MLNRKVNHITIGSISEDQKKRLFFYIFTFCIFFIIAINLYDFYSINNGYNKGLRAGEITFSPSSMKANGYEIIKDQYLNKAGDSQFLLPPVNRFVNTVKIDFSNYSKQDLNIAIYYADSTHGYSEKYVKSGMLTKDSLELTILINSNVTDLRVDIGNKIGEEFSLKSITINDPNTFREKNLNIFQQNIKFLAFLFILLLTYILIFYDGRIERIYLVSAIGLGLLYLVIITPFSVPDEMYHYQTAFQLSNIMMFHWKDSLFAQATYFDYRSFAGHYNVSSAYLRTLQEFFLPIKQSELVTIPMPRNLNYPGYYVPQALGIAIARLLDLNVILTFYLGRTFNLAFYITCVYFAIKKTPKLKTTFLLLGITPMAMQQAASYSYDAFINAVSFLLIAYFISAIYGEEKLTKKDYFFIIVASALLAPAKIVYYPILFMAFLIPVQKFRNGREREIVVSLILGIGLLSMVAFNIPNISKIAGNTDMLNWEQQHNYSISFILQHPIKTVSIFWNTILQNCIEYFFESFGLRLSGLTLSLPVYIIGLFIILVLVSAINNNNNSDGEKINLITGKQRLFFLAIYGMIIILVMLSMFLSWTSDNRPIIAGIQGRYFVPILPLLCLAVSDIRVKAKYDLSKMLVLVCAILQCVAIFTIVDYTIVH